MQVCCRVSGFYVKIETFFPDVDLNVLFFANRLNKVEECYSTLKRITERLALPLDQSFSHQLTLALYGAVFILKI